jgi:hypothetical protein
MIDTMRKDAKRKDSRAGQMQQLFIFLSAMLIIVATIWLGMKLIGTIGSSACDADNALFQQELKDALDANALYGNRDIVEISPSCDAIDLCFVDSRSIGTAVVGDTRAYSAITTIVTSGSKENIFLVDSDKAPHAKGYDERIYLPSTPGDTPNTYKCFKPDSSGKFSFKVEGYGRYLVISNP